MITCKEDLLKTYVVNDGEIRSLYVGLCNKFGIECESNSNASGAVDVTNADYIEVYAGICFYTNTPSKESSRELTIDDLKEKTKPTKFVKVEGSIFDLKEEFEKGELYRVYAHHGDNPMHGAIDSEFSLIQAADRSNIYRKVEITERDLFIDMIEQAGAELLSDGEWSFACLAASVFDSGHIKLTDKPE